MKGIMLFAAAAVVIAGGANVIAQTKMKPPVAKKVPHITKIHGIEMVDNYHWLRDRNQKKDPAIIEYLEAENRYTEDLTKDLKPVQDKIYQEMLGRIKQDDSSVPYKLGDFWYFTKTETGKQYPTFLRSKTQDGKNAETLLDVNKMAEGHKFYSIGLFSVNNAGDMLAFSVDTTGYRQYTLQFKDLKTGEILPEKVERSGGGVWSADDKYFFHSTEDEEDKRNNQIWRREVGKNKSELIYQEDDVLFTTGVRGTKDKKYIFIVSGAATMTEFRYIPADKPFEDFKVIVPREKDHEYSVDHWGDDFYITTNKKAENFRVVKTPVSDPSEKNWVDFIPSNPAVKIDGISFFKDFAVVSELENGLDYLKVMDLKTRRAPMRIPTDEEVYSMGMAANPEFDTDVIRYGYSSMITPASTYEFDMKTRKSKVIKQQEIPSGYDKSKYETKRLWAVARDGVKVPISVVMKKGTKLNGKSPMLLYAYGSYGISMDPGFSTSRFSLVDRGMIYAIAHIRGGSELGEQWRQQGRMFKKLNTFYDFVDSAKWLIGQKYTSSDRLVIQGGSAGGLLMGAVVNMSPETFKAAIVQVPFVDVMNTMLDETLPLTTGEWIEWGNPNEKEAFDYMIKYSPYDNISAQKYPNMLIETSLFDSQVAYWEAAKYTAKLRANAKPGGTYLLKTNMTAGHGGASGRYDRLKEVAFDYAYALDQVGIKD